MAKAADAADAADVAEGVGDSSEAIELPQQMNR